MKKFLNAFLLILNNQKGNLDLGSGEEQTGEADHDSSEDLSNEGLLAEIHSESEDHSETESNDDGQPNEEPAEGDDLEAKLNSLEVEKPEESENSLLDELNKMGILHNGLPVDFDDLEKAKEYLSKGFDYTQKTQELAEQRKTADAEIAQEREAFESERVAFQEERAQNQTALDNYGAFKNMIAEIQQADPDLLEELDGYFSKHQSQIMANQSNPVISKLEAKINSLEEKLNGNSENEETKQLGEIKKTWETGIKEVQSSFGPKLKTLGIKPDWAKVQEVWKADNTNSMTVKQALFAHYGEQIEKAMGNKSKIAETRAKVARTGSKVENEDSSDVFGMTSGNSYENEAFEILKTLE